MPNGFGEWECKVKVNTKNFGEIEISDSKMITFEKGIVGYPNLTRFALIHDAEKNNKAGIRWLQSLDELTFALPVMDPLCVIASYNPMVDEEILKKIGDLKEDDMLVMVTVTVPKDITKLSVNLCAPIIINAENRQACQIITDSERYPIKYEIYDILQKMKEEGEQNVSVNEKKE